VTNVFRGEHVQRIVIDLTQGEDAVVTVVDVPFLADEPEEPVFIPYTLESLEVYEDYTVIRNSCA